MLMDQILHLETMVETITRSPVVSGLLPFFFWGRVPLLK